MALSHSMFFTGISRLIRSEASLGEPQPALGFNIFQSPESFAKGVALAQSIGPTGLVLGQLVRMRLFAVARSSQCSCRAATLCRSLSGTHDSTLATLGIVPRGSFPVQGFPKQHGCLF